MVCVGLRLLILILLALSSAHAQVSGGLEGRWQHYVLSVDAGHDRAEPIIDVWIDGDLLAWKTRAPVSREMLTRSLVWRPGLLVAVPPAAAQVSTSVEQTVTGSSFSGLTHLIVEEGVVTSLVRLRLADDCIDTCRLIGLDVVEFGQNPFSVAGPRPATLRTPVDWAVPIEPGDVVRTWR